MKTLKSKVLKLSSIVLTVSISLISCGPSKEEMENRESKSKAFADSVSTAIQQINKTPMQADSNRTFIRTADLSFKVKDVKLSTFEIERIVSEHHGYITSSNLESQINQKTSIRISKDTALDVIHYSVHNDIIIRIPNHQLDKMLAEASSLIDYLDFRKIRADDVTKNFQGAKLSENRFLAHQKRLEKAIDGKGQKLDQMINGENDLLAKHEWADDSRVQTLELAHDVAYSTVSINIYQAETTKKEITTYASIPEPYVPSFGTKVMEALFVGGHILSEIFLFCLKLAPISFFIFIIIIGIKRLIKQKWFANNFKI